MRQIGRRAWNSVIHLDERQSGFAYPGVCCWEYGMEYDLEIMFMRAR